MHCVTPQDAQVLWTRRPPAAPTTPVADLARSWPEVEMMGADEDMTQVTD